MIHTYSKAGKSIRCLVFGHGSRPFVLLPGLSMISVLKEAAHHEKVYDLFSETHTVYLFEYPEVPGGQTTLEQIAEDVASGMRQAGILHADVLGVSMGGMIAQCIAAFHPDLVGRLALASSSVSVGSPDSLRNWIALAETRPGDEVAGILLSEIHGPSFAAAAAVAASGMKRWPDAERQRFLTLARACLSFDGRRYASSVSCPVLVIGSAGDRVCPLSAWAETADLLRAESFLYGKQYGHAVYTEAPDFRARVLAYFLRPEDAGEERTYNDRKLIWTSDAPDELVAKTPVFHLMKRKETSADGMSGEYIRMKAPDWVMVVPDLGEEFLMVRQWRHGMEGLTNEFPGGVVDGNESAESCALRELEEETGYSAGKLTFLGSCNPNAALQNNRVSIYLAEDLFQKHDHHPDADERIAVLRVNKEEAIASFATGDYQHAFTGLAMFLYLRRKRKG